MADSAKRAPVLADKDECASSEMTQQQIQYVVDLLMKKDVVLERGLSNEEIRDAELRHCFQFPPDLRLFLATALPVSTGFPAYITVMRSAKPAITPRSWVIITMAAPVAFRAMFSVSRICA